MHNYQYCTVAELVAQYRQCIKDWLRQWEYERTIARSVPPKHIAICSCEPTTSELEDLG